jgi:hypothetical protein
MAISPNTNFTVGAVFTAAQANAFPFGNVALATSTTSYTVTTSTVIATGMTVTWTAIANRNYKITYYEPQILTPSVTNGFVSATIRLTNAAGAASSVTYSQTNSATPMTQIGGASVIKTFSAGSVTIVGCLVASSTTGTPVAARDATSPSYLLVEDLGPA